MPEECHVFKEVKIVKRKSIRKSINRKSFMMKRYKENDKHLEHLERIKNIKSETDSAPPMFMLSSICPISKIVSDKDRLNRILKDNIALLGRLNDIQRSNSIYNERNDRTCKINMNSRFNFRLKTIEKIEKQNFSLGKRITNVSGDIPSVKILNSEWENTLMNIRRQCNQKLSLPELMKRKSFSFVGKNRPMVYLDIGLKEESRPLGRLIIMLYLDLAPITVKNFIDLCENHRDWPNPNGNDSDKRSYPEKLSASIQNSNSSTLSYEYITKDCQLIGTTFTRIFPRLFIYGGKLNVDKKPKFRGIPDYEPEKFKYHHGYKGTLSMCPMENGLINSEFTISLKPLPVLDNKRLVFGRVISGLGILDTVAGYGTKNGKPQKNVEILDCGIFDLNLE